MRKWMFLLVTATLLISPYLFAETVRTEELQSEVEALVGAYTDRWAVLPEWQQAPDIDGELDEGLWGQAVELGDFRTAYENASVANSPAYKAAYDETYLYIGGTFSLEEQETLAHIELIFSPGTSGNEHYVAVIPVNRERPITTEWNRSVFPTDTPTRYNITSFDYEMRQDSPAGLFTVEAAIPWSAFSVPVPAPGEEWRMNIAHLHNVNTKPLSSWTPIRTSRYMDRSGGTVTYSVNLVDHGRLGSIFFDQTPYGLAWTPDVWELRYMGFTEKQLSFESVVPELTQFHMQWKEPQGDWMPLTKVNPIPDPSRIILEFDHPQPLHDGMYQLRLVADTIPPSGGQVAIFSFDREQLIAAGKIAVGYAPPTGRQTPVTPAPASPQVQDVLDLIPDKTGFRFVGLPEMPELSPDGLYALSPDGKSLNASRTGTVYPNAQYPETQVFSATDRNGNLLEYPYYEDAEGKRYFISAHLWHLQKTRAITQTETIAGSDPLGGARLLYRFAEAYESYVPTTDEHWYNFPLNFSSGYPYNYWGGVWNRWHLSDLNSLRPLMRAYAKVKQTDAFEILSQEIGIDVERKIVEEMFLPSAEYLFSYPVTLANMDFSIWLGLIELGQSLDDPDFLHRTVAWIRDYVSQKHLSDGFWFEITTSYHQQSINGLINAINQLRGYSDPPGYVSPRTGKRFDNLDLYSEYPILDKARVIQPLLAYPDGKTLPIQDTWASTAVSSPNRSVGSFLLPSAGIGRLTLGEGTGQSQLYLQFVPKYGHNHFDPLNLNLYAGGQELLPDLGYTYSKYRYFTTSTLGHNTVVVNSRNMTSGSAARDGGSIEQFVTLDDSPFQVLRASQQEAYAETEEYSREPWFVSYPDDPDKGYVLDLFRVSGGHRHEYTLNGDANRVAYFETDLSLDDYGPRLLPPGVEAVEAEEFNESGSAEGHYPGYIYVKDVQQAQLTDDQYRVTMSTFDQNGAKAKLGITGLLEAGDNELFLGRSPSVRTTRLFGNSRDNNDDAELYDMPKLVHRRDGTDLSSTFVTLLEPYGADEAARIEAIDRLTPDQALTGAVAVQITYGDTTDIVLSNPRHPDQWLTVGDLAMRGEMGFIRLKDGMVTDMRLIGGTDLKKGQIELTGAGEVTGEIVSTLSATGGDVYDALLTAAAVPAEAVGHYVIMTDPDGRTKGLKIGDIQQVNGQTAIVLADQDPGFAFYGDGTSGQTYYPAKRWADQGTHTFRIALETRWDGPPQPDPAPTSVLTGAVYDQDGALLTDAAVHVTGYPSIASVTDNNGEFVLCQVPVGTRRVTAAKDGYGRGVSAAVIVASGQTKAVSVTLSDTPPPLLSEVSALVGLGDPVMATSSKAADLYLVPSATLPFAADIIAAVASSGSAVSDVSVGVPAMVDTTGLASGAYRLYAIDKNGNVSVGAAVGVLPKDAVYVDDEDDLVNYSGSWRSFSNTAYIGGTVKRADSAGSYVDIPFYGSAAKVYGSTSTNNGYAHIYVDGILQTTIDTYSTSTLYQQELYATDLLEEGPHVLRIEAIGTKREAANNFYVTFDAVQVLHESNIPATLSDVTPSPIVAGTPVQARSSKDGMLYLVPATTEATAVAIEAAGILADGRSATVTAGVYGMLDTTGLPVNLYYLYAIGMTEEVSAPAGIAILEPMPQTVDDGDATVDYVGAWTDFTNTVYYGGTVKRAGETGAYVDIPFYGSEATLLGSRNFNTGQAHIYVDGIYQTTIDSYSPTVQYQQELYQTGSLPIGMHMLRMEVAGTRNPASTGYFVSFDALVVEPLSVPLPVITGVVDGGVYERGVVITIDYDGSYTAKLNGQLFASGGIVEVAGEYTVTVIDEQGRDTTVHFTIVPPADPLAAMLVQIDRDEAEGEIVTVFADQLRYRLQIIDLLREQGDEATAVAYMQDFIRYIRDPSVLAQQLISGEAAERLEDLVQPILLNSAID